MSINVLAELERCGIDFKWSSEDYIEVTCPFHNDESPSATLAVKGGNFKCFAASCGRHGDFVTYLAGKFRTSRAAIVTDLSKRYQLDTTKVISPDTIERYHSAIWEAAPLLKELHDRGVTDEMIRRHRLGVKDNRISIPIKSESGLFVNVRYYLPGAPGDQKMKNSKGRSKPRFFPADQLKFDDILIVGGEMKAIVCLDQLNPHGVGVVCVTGSEGTWTQELTERLTGKRAWICFDIDEGGRVAADKVAGALYPAVRWLGVVHLPLDPDKYPTGDPNDYIAREGGLMLPLLETCEQWQPKQRRRKSEDGDEPEAVSLAGAINAKRTGKRIRFTGVVTQLDTSPYILPKTVLPICDRSQPMCSACAVWAAGKDVEMEIDVESPEILELVAAPKYRQRETLMSCIGVPKSCASFEAEVTEHINAEDVKLSPSLDIASRGSEKILQSAICIGHGLEANEPYEMVGRLYPSPATQQSMLLVSSYKATQDALSTYVPKNTEPLRAFQPKEWSLGGLCDKFADLYSDLETNVTGILERRDLHLVVDLAYHSPLVINFDHRLEKGRVEILVCGDSSQGKSELLKHIMSHYRIGERIEGKNCTAAGLLGGLTQTGKRWILEWGIIPTHDKRLVAIDELKGADVSVISKLTDMRSTGIAEITKIEKRRTHARTRLIMMSNPRGGNVTGYAYGVQAILELMGSPEDVRRLDLAMIVAAQEVDFTKLNEQRSRSVPHVHTSELCRELILWAWTREPSQVKFDEDVEQLIYATANDLSNRYSDVIPLLDRGSTRHKVARLAASLAARTFSSDDGETLIVRACHVEYIAKFIDKLYSNPFHGYLAFSSATKVTCEMGDPDKVEKAIRATPFPMDFVTALLHADRLDATDIEDWCGWDRDQAQDLMSLLVRKRAITRDGRRYRKNPALIELLRRLQQAEDLNDRPDFVEEF